MKSISKLLFLAFFIAISSIGYSQASSDKGYCMDPKGLTKALIVFADVDKDSCPLLGGSLANPTWPEDSLPINANDYFDPILYPTGPEAYLTKYFYEQSFGDLIILGDYVNKLVRIPCNTSMGTTEYITKWLDTVFTNYENDSLANPLPFKYGSTLNEFDNWKISDASALEFGNKPNIPNNRFDLLIIIRRNNKWYDVGSGKFEGGAIIYLSSTSSYPMGSNFISMDNKGDFKCQDGSVECQKFIIQELFHSLYGGNHWHSSDGAGEHTFMNKTSPWGIATQLAGAGISQIATGYDRDFLGWKGWKDNNKTVRKDSLISALDTNGNEVHTNFTSLSSLSSNLFVLRDMANYGDAIRIKLPYLNEDPDHPTAKNQYLWIENHQLQSKFDVGNYQGVFSPDCKDSLSKGMYAYVQVGKDLKQAVSATAMTSSTPGAANGLASWIFPLSAEGNYDFFIADTLQSGYVGCSYNAFHAVMDKFDSRTLENPFIGYSDLFNFYNSDNDNILEHKSPQDKFQFNGGEIFNGVGPVKYSFYQMGDSEDAFGTNSNNFKISISTNPASTPVYTLKSQTNFNGSSSFLQPTEPYENRTIWLNGVSAELLDENYKPSVYNNGAILVKIRFDDYDVKNNVRWCGNIKLSNHINDSTINDFSDSLYSLKLCTNKTILFDRGKSYTYDRSIDQDSITNNYFFNEPTQYTIRSNAYMLMDKNSNVIADGGSTIRLQAGSLLEMSSKSHINIKKGSKLIIESGAQLILHDSAYVKIEDGGRLEYDNASIKLLGHNSYFDFEGTMWLLPNSEFTFTGDGYIKFSKPGIIGSAASPSNIIAGAGSKITLVGTGINDKVLEITQETMYAHLSLAKFTLENGKAELGDNARLSVDCDIKLFNAKISTITGGAENHRGLTIFGQPNIDIKNSTFEKGKYGIYAINTYGGAPLSLKSCRFENCEYGLTTIDKGATLQNCVFLNNKIKGWNAIGMTFPSYVGGGQFKSNIVGGTFLATGTSPLHVNKGSVFQNVNNGFEFDGPSMLTFTCGNVTANGVGSEGSAGVFFKNNAILNNSPFILPYGGKSNFSNNENAVRSACANNWYLIGGRNNFTSVDQCALGTFNLNCTAPYINSIYNQWKSAIVPPVNGTDFNLMTYSCSPNIPALLNEIAAQPSLACSVIWTPTPSERNAIANANPLEKCPACEKIETDDYSKVKLNDAIVHALSYVEIADTLNEDSINDNIKAIDLLHQILTFEFRQNKPDKRLNADEIWLLEHAYSKIKELLSRAISKEQTTATLTTSEVEKVLACIDAMGELIDFTGSHDKMLYFGLDKAGIYKLINERELALKEIDLINGCFAHDPEQLAYIKNLRDITFTEWQLQKGSIKKEDFEKVFLQIQNGTSIFSQGIYTNVVSDSSFAQGVYFVGETIDLNSGTNSILYSWDFGDCSTSTLAQPDHTYLNSGNYSITLAQSSDCFTGNNGINLMVLPVPVGEVIQTKTNIDCGNVLVTLDKSFTADLTSSCFSNSSIPVSTSNLRFRFEWDFTTPTRMDFTEYFSFDSILSNQDSLIHIRIMKGLESEVTLTATIEIIQNGNWLNTGYEFIYNDLFLNEQEFVFRGFVDSTYCQVDSVHFSSLITGGVAPFEIEWHIDGTDYHTQNFAHIFSKSGTYPVEMEVRDANGCLANMFFDQLSSHVHWSFADSGTVADSHAGFEIEIPDCKTINGYALEATTCGNSPIAKIYFGLMDQNRVIYPNYALSDESGYFEFSPSFIASLDTNLLYSLVVVRPNNFIVLDRNTYSLSKLIGSSPIDVMLGSTQISAVNRSTSPSATTITSTVSDGTYTYSTGYISNATIDFYTKKVDALNNTIWESIFNGHASGPDTAKAICLDSLGNVYVTGVSWNGTDYDFLTIKYDSTGLEQWVNAYDDSLTSNDIAHSICIDSLGQVCVHGSVNHSSILEFATVIYANCTPLNTPPIRSNKPQVPKKLVNENYSVTIYPNPNREGLLNIRSNISSTSLTFTLTDITGKSVFTTGLSSGNAIIKIPDHVISGVYICILKNSENSVSVTNQRLILIR